MSRMHHVEGVERGTVDITVRLGARALQRLRDGWIACTKVFLTEQPDGSFALGVVTDEPSDLSRSVETDDRETRFPDYDGGFDGPS